MDTALLTMLLEIAAQAASGATKESEAAKLLILGFTPLEATLIAAIGSLFAAATLAVKKLFTWGTAKDDKNDNAHQKRNDAFTKVLTDQTADNKNVVHTLENIDKTLGKSDYGPVLAELKATLDAVDKTLDAQTRTLADVKSMVQTLINK